LIEMVVAVGILIIIVGLTLGNYPKFRDQTALKRTAQEVTSAVRQAQSYALGVKRYFGGTGNCSNIECFPAYGVHFETGAGLNQSFIVFADVPPADYLYNFDEKVEEFTIQTGDRILRLCGDSDCSLTELDVVYERPNPLVSLSGCVGGNCSDPYSYSEASIVVGKAGASEKIIKVFVGGQISVQ